MTPEEFDALPTEKWVRRLPAVLAAAEARYAAQLAHPHPDSARCPECGALLAAILEPVLIGDTGGDDVGGELEVAHCRGCPYTRLARPDETYYKRAEPADEDA